MNNSQKTDGPKQFLNLLKEITGFGMTILVYIFAVLGRPLPPFQAYPATTSILTILISIIFLWLWRWSKITSRKSTKPATGRKKNSVEPSQNHVFNMPLRQRRLETVFLMSLTLIAISIAGIRYPIILEEFGGLHCINKSSNVPKVVIASFVPSESNQFGNSLANVMGMQARDRYQICRYNPEITLFDEPIDIGQKHQATLVIWGNISGDWAEVYVTAIDWNMLNQRDDAIPVRDGQDDIVLLAESVLADLLFSQNQISDAQNGLRTALEMAEEQKIDQTNPTLLADSYFLLGLLYDPDQVDELLANTRQAIRSYSRTIQLNSNFNSAYLNRATLYLDEGETGKAIDDLSNIISREGTSASDTYLMRGQIYLREKKYPNAIFDFNTALNDSHMDVDNPLYPYLVHYLGKSYLLDGDIPLAEQTYQHLTSLSEDDAQLFIKELRELASTPISNNVKEAITRIINRIQQLQLS